MGLFDSVKKSLGLASAELELKVQPGSAHVDGEVKGELVMRALKDIEIFGLDIALYHGFRDEWGGIEQDVFERGSVAEMISMQAGEHQSFPFFIGIPAEVAPTIGPFSWKIEATARLKGASDLSQKQTLQVHFSPVMGAIMDIVQKKFGFVYKRAGADEDCIWMEFTPSGPVRNMYRSLELSFDEQPGQLAIWVGLEPFSPRVLQRFHEDYDPHENTIELIINKRQYVAGHQVDTEALFQLLKPLFSP